MPASTTSRVDWWVAEGLPAPPSTAEHGDAVASAGKSASGNGRAARRQPRCGWLVNPADRLTEATVAQTWALCTCVALVVGAFVAAAAATGWLLAEDLLPSNTAPLFSTDLAGGFRDATRAPVRELRAARAALRWGRLQEGIRRAATGATPEDCSEIDWWTGATVCGVGSRTERAAGDERWRLQLLLRSGDGGDLFSPLYLDKLRSFALVLASLDGLGDVCRADTRAATGCAPIRSPLDFFYPSTVASSYNFSTAQEWNGYFVQPADALGLPSAVMDGVTVAKVPMTTMVFDGGGLATAELAWCIVDHTDHDGREPACSSDWGDGLPSWAPPRCRPCTDHWCNCAPYVAAAARGTKQRVEAAAAMLAATNRFTADLQPSFDGTTTVLKLDLPLGIPLKGYASIADRREEQEELLSKWVTESLQPEMALQEAILGAEPQPIELVVSIPAASSPWTVTFRGALVHDAVLGLLAAGMPLLFAARHTGYSGCLVFTMLALEFAAVGFAWVLSRVLIGVALYATTASGVLLLLPLQFHAVTCLLDEWRNVILHDKLTVTRGAAPKFATSVMPRDAEERNVADRIRFMHNRGTASILIVTAAATAAFLAVGFTSPFPAVASFGIFAGLVLLVFVVLLVMLFPCTMLIYHRSAEGRDGCCCCLTPIHTPQTPEPPQPGDEEKVKMPILPVDPRLEAPPPPPPPPPPTAPPGTSETSTLMLGDRAPPPPRPGTASGTRSGNVTGGAKARGDYYARWEERKKKTGVGPSDEPEDEDIPTKQRCQLCEVWAARWANHKKVRWLSAPVALAAAAACVQWGVLKLEPQIGVRPLLPEWHTTQMVAELLSEFGTDNTTETVSVLILWGLGIESSGGGDWAGERPAPTLPLFGTPDVWSAQYLWEKDVAFTQPAVLKEAGCFAIVHYYCASVDTSRIWAPNICLEEPGNANGNIVPGGCRFVAASANVPATCTPIAQCGAAEAVSCNALPGCEFRNPVLEAATDWKAVLGVDLSAAAAQTFIRDTCAELESRAGVRSVTCPLADFAVSRLAAGSSFPTPAAALGAGLAEWLATTWESYAGAESVESTEQQPEAWPFDLVGVDIDGSVRYIGVRIETALPLGSDGEALAAATVDWGAWVDSVNAVGGSSAAGVAVVVAEDGQFVDAETAGKVVGDVLTTGVASMAAAIGVLILSGCNVLVVLVFTLSHGSAMAMVLAVIHWSGWMIGNTESLWISLLVGLTVGRPAHIAYSFTQAALPDRPDRVLQAVTGSWATCATAEGVVIGQGVLLWLAWAVPLSRLGALLLLGAAAGALTTHLIMLPALALCGPHGEFLLWNKAYLPLSLRPVFRAACKVGSCSFKCGGKGKKRKDGGEMYVY